MKNQAVTEAYTTKTAEIGGTLFGLGMRLAIHEKDHGECSQLADDYMDQFDQIKSEVEQIEAERELNTKEEEGFIARMCEIEKFVEQKMQEIRLKL